MKDSAIIDLFFERSDLAVFEIEIKYGAKMKSYANRYLSDSRDAEEIYNDTLVAIWNAIPPECPNKLMAYIMAVLECKVINRLKYIGREKRSRSGEVMFEDFDDILKFAGMTDSAEDVVINSMSGMVDEFLATENSLSRRLFLKRYYFGKTVSEIADEAEMSESAVASRISRTKMKLYKYLKEKGVTV